MSAWVLRSESRLVVCSLNYLNRHTSTLACLWKNIWRLRLELVGWNKFYFRWCRLLCLLIGFRNLRIGLEISSILQGFCWRWFNYSFFSLKWLLIIFLKHSSDLFVVFLLGTGTQNIIYFIKIVANKVVLIWLFFLCLSVGCLAAYRLEVETIKGVQI